MTLTPHAERTLNAIRGYKAKFGYEPTEYDLSLYMGYTTTTAARKTLPILAAMGFILRDPKHGITLCNA